MNVQTKDLGTNSYFVVEIGHSVIVWKLFHGHPELPVTLPREISSFLSGLLSKILIVICVPRIALPALVTSGSCPFAPLLLAPLLYASTDIHIVTANHRDQKSIDIVNQITEVRNSHTEANLLQKGLPKLPKRAGLLSNHICRIRNFAQCRMPNCISHNLYLNNLLSEPKIFKRPKHREDTSDFDEFWTD